MPLPQSLSHSSPKHCLLYIIFFDLVLITSKICSLSTLFAFSQILIKPSSNIIMIAFFYKGGQGAMKGTPVTTIFLLMKTQEIKYTHYFDTHVQWYLVLTISNCLGLRTTFIELFLEIRKLSNERRSKEMPYLLAHEHMSSALQTFCD